MYTLANYFQIPVAIYSPTVSQVLGYADELYRLTPVDHKDPVQPLNIAHRSRRLGKSVRIPTHASKLKILKNGPGLFFFQMNHRGNVARRAARPLRDAFVTFRALLFL